MHNISVFIAAVKQSVYFFIQGQQKEEVDTVNVCKWWCNVWTFVMGHKYVIYYDRVLWVPDQMASLGQYRLWANDVAHMRVCVRVCVGVCACEEGGGYVSKSFRISKQPHRNKSA